MTKQTVELEMATPGIDADGGIARHPLGLERAISDAPELGGEPASHTAVMSPRKKRKTSPAAALAIRTSHVTTGPAGFAPMIPGVEPNSKYCSSGPTKSFSMPLLMKAVCPAITGLTAVAANSAIWPECI